MRGKNFKNKKLGVLVSSLALVGVTALAGVTGTAAWFTANRANTATASTFTAYAPQADLSITANGIEEKGTVQKSDDTKAIVVKDNNDSGTTTNYLRDASYDAKNKVLYRANVADDKNAATDTKNPVPTSYAVVSNYYSGTSVSVTSGDTTTSHKVYYAVSWTYTLSYNNPNANGSALFFDPVNSKLTNTGTGTDTNIENGFRIAMNGYKPGYSTEASATQATVKDNGYIVWSNDSVTTYVSQDKTASTPTTTDASSSVVGNYDNYSSTVNFFQNSVSGYSTHDDGLTSVTNLPDYIGTFKASTDTITITCTAWYEGSDNAVLTSKATQAEAISASMRFYVRDLGTASGK
jgi:hypothetical protein